MKIIKLSYLAIIFLFSLSSTFTTWANDRNPILMLEITINLLIMAGLVFSIKKITIKWWSTIIALIFFGESTLLLTDQTIGAKEIFTWCLILSPAIILHSQVAGIINYKQSIGNAG